MDSRAAIVIGGVGRLARQRVALARVVDLRAVRQDVPALAPHLQQTRAASHPCSIVGEPAIEPSRGAVLERATHRLSQKPLHCWLASGDTEADH